MNKKEIMYKFIKKVESRKKLTLLIINLFDYQNFDDYNYISRIIMTENEIIIDIYDNISVNRFNRYIFDFSNGIHIMDRMEKNNVFITTIWVENVKNSSDKLLKFAYLFKILDVEYAKTFLSLDIVNILSEIITL